MGAFGLESWERTDSGGGWTSLLLGNGASIAISDVFRYDSLYDAAPLSVNDRDLFQALETTNFEDTLNHLRTAELICRQLAHASDEVEDRYVAIQGALIEAVNNHHVLWSDINRAKRLERIRASLLEYQTVFTTNYDLIVYWAMMIDGAGAGFGDLFWNASHTFNPLDTEPRDDKTIVYWLHGGLHLLRNTWGEAVKRVNEGMGLLDSFYGSPHPALFISEGTWQRKRRAIRQSDYLEHAYMTLCNNEDDIVIFGHSLGSQDRHLIDALRQSPRRRIAFGIYPGTQTQVDLQRDRIRDEFSNAKLRFFDSTTHPLGEPSLKL
jgi:hypothetical protein